MSKKKGQAVDFRGVTSLQRSQGNAALDNQDRRRESAPSNSLNTTLNPVSHVRRRTSEPYQQSHDEQRQAGHSRRATTSDIDRCEHGHETQRPPRIICASPHFPDIQAAANVLGGKVHVVDSNQEALEAIASRKFQALVCGFGTLSDTPYCSPLIGYAQQAAPGMHRIVYSPQSQQQALSRYLYHSCFVCGADAVTWSLQSLTFALVGLQQFQSVVPVGTKIAAHEEDIYSSYPPLRHLQQRQDQLVCIARGNNTMRAQALSEVAQKLELQLRTVPRDFYQTTDTSNKNKNRRRPSTSIRLVHVSDTNNHHRHLILPRGDLFVHTGNFTNPMESKAHSLAIFEDFLHWLEEQVMPKFELVVFIAGNHDDVLDSVHYVSLKEHLAAKQMLEKFLHEHPTVRYLENSATLFHDLVIYGSPTVYCKSGNNTDGHLNAFETSMEESHDAKTTNHRQQQHLNGIDILLTNRAPSILSTSKDYSLPIDRLYNTNTHTNKSTKPPLVHAFGHNNHNFGIGFYHGTIMMNGSQELLHSMDPYCGGTPLVINIPLPDSREQALCGPRLFHHSHRTNPTSTATGSTTNTTNQNNEHNLIEC